MRSLLGPIFNRAPAYAGSGRVSIPWVRRTGAEAQMAAMGSVGTLFAIVNRTSTAVAKAEWKLYRKSPTGLPEDREEVLSHPALDLWRQPNQYYSRQRFVETVQQHLDLTGEGWWITARNPKVKRLPLELWPIRPDRMAPVPDPDSYISGYSYTDPDGREIPLGIDEVVQILMPNPLDPYRGMGPVQTILTDLDSARYSAEWNRNFFRNDASPGGIFEVDKRLSDEEFDELATRWAEQHKGVANAHRVAIIEQGRWVQRAFSQRDMQFAELRTVSRDTILEAFGFPKSMLGITEDVNRANAESGEYVFAKWLTVPRLDRWKGVLNGSLLPLYGPTGAGLEFDYTSPVPEDEAAENAERASKATAAKTLLEAGLDPDDVLSWAGLPPMRMREIQPPVPVVAPVVAARAVAPRRTALALPASPRNAAWPDEDPVAVEGVDLSGIQADWESALAALLVAWVAILADWIDQLLAAVRRMLRRGEVDLGLLQTDLADGEALLTDAMVDLAGQATDRVVEEAAAQGVRLDPVEPARDDLASVAHLMAALDAERLALSAGAETARVAHPDVPVDDTVQQIREHLESLSDAGPRMMLGAALTAAQQQARIATYQAGPVGALYASEVLDTSTCGPCEAIHGRFIATTDDLAPLFKLYPTAGYRDCEGGWRCRGTVVGVWRPQTAKGGR